MYNIYVLYYIYKYKIIPTLKPYLTYLLYYNLGFFIDLTTDSVGYDNTVLTHILLRSLNTETSLKNRCNMSSLTFIGCKQTPKIATFIWKRKQMHMVKLQPNCLL